MTAPGTLEIVGASLFALAVVHTFSTKYFEHLAHTRTAHAGLFHLLGEVEAVFGFWAFVLIGFMAVAFSWGEASAYLNKQHFVEPMFVFVIMVIAASRPVMQFASDMVEGAARVLPVRQAVAVYFLSLALVPLLGSFITEPAAMTLAALMLRDRVFAAAIPSRVKYATLAVLFVNVSIGGTLTNFAAPPVLMVAAKWEWTSAFMLSQFGWKAAIAVLVNAVAVTALFGRQLPAASPGNAANARSRVPAFFVLLNLVLLAGVVFTNHQPEAFMGVFLLFLGLSEAYRRHHERLILREGLMVAFFLAGLVVLGGMQGWWLQGLLTRMSETGLFYGATALTAITDNAALTYLGSLVDGLSDEAKYSLVAGAVTGGGLTVIANAPNPAGFAILKDKFDDGAISALGLFLYALPPTLVAVVCFRGLGGGFDLIDLPGWQAWLESLDPAFAFLLILPFVVGAVGLWAEFRKKD